MNTEVSQSCLTLVTLWTVAHQAPSSMGFSRNEYSSGLPFPSPGDLPNPGIEPRSPTFRANTLTFELPEKIEPVEEKVMALHSSTLAWKIPGIEKPGRLRSMGSLRVGHD